MYVATPVRIAIAAALVIAAIIPSAFALGDRLKAPLSGSLHPRTASDEFGLRFECARPREGTEITCSFTRLTLAPIEADDPTRCRVKIDTYSHRLQSRGDEWISVVGPAEYDACGATVTSRFMRADASGTAWDFELRSDVAHPDASVNEGRCGDAVAFHRQWTASPAPQEDRARRECRTIEVF